ncbi:MAG: hypothetical protein ACRCTZ_03810 [Sarcina sp.]
MKLQDLKDGMVLKLRGNGKRVYVFGRMYNIMEDNKLELIRDGFYNEDLTNKVTRICDIVKVSYDEKTLWERKERKFVGYKEAKESGRKVRFDAKEDGLYGNMETLVGYTRDFGVLEKMFTENLWEIDPNDAEYVEKKESEYLDLDRVVDLCDLKDGDKILYIDSSGEKINGVVIIKWSFEVQYMPRKRIYAELEDGRKISLSKEAISWLRFYKIKGE